MKRLNWKKVAGGLMAGMMTFSIMGTTLAVPAYAASRHHSHHEQWERDHYRRVHHDRQREARERAEAQRAHDKKVQTNQKIAAAAIGAVVGAVIAKNT